MGISRDSRHKRRLTGGRMPIHQKKRKFELGRPAANTKLIQGEKKIHLVRARGGRTKFRALALNNGNFNWPSHGKTFKTQVLNTMYNASNNDLVRTNTLVKGMIVSIDATPIVAFINQHYNGKIGFFYVAV